MHTKALRKGPINNIVRTATLHINYPFGQHRALIQNGTRALYRSEIEAIFAYHVRLFVDIICKLLGHANRISRPKVIAHKAYIDLKTVIVAKCIH